MTFREYVGAVCWLCILVMLVTAPIAALWPESADAAPSAECYAEHDDAWCDTHAEALAAAKPVFAYLVTDDPVEVGGYQAGDIIPTGHGDAVPVPQVALDAVAGTEANVEEERLMVDLAACESRFVLFADGPGTASGPWQFLRSTWATVSAATGLGDLWSWIHQAHNTLWLGRNGGWQHWECLGIVR